MNWQTRQMLKMLWPFLALWFGIIVFRAINEDRDIDFMLGLALVAVSFGFAIFIRKKLIAVENLAKTGKYFTAGNFSYLRLFIFMIPATILIDEITNYIGVDDHQIPTIIIMGVVISGLLLGFFPRTPKDNEFRGKR